MTKVNELLAALSEDVIVQGRGVQANSWFDLELVEALEAITQAIVKDDGLQYLRVKSEVIFIGGMEVPKPESKAPSLGKMYFTPSLTDEMLYDAMTWNDDSYDKMYLKRKLVHLNSDAAMRHAKALIDGEHIEFATVGNWATSTTANTLSVLRQWSFDCTSIDLRIKPQTIQIGEFTVPAPLRKPPSDTYYYVDIAYGDVEQMNWDNTGDENTWLANGVLFSTEQGAELFLAAIHSLTKEPK